MLNAADLVIEGDSDSPIWPLPKLCDHQGLSELPAAQVHVAVYPAPGELPLAVLVSLLEPVVRPAP